MSRTIDMYNAYFGDCFVIRDDDESLVVDFGIHQAAKVGSIYKNKNRLKKDIATALSKYDNLSLLITHFHYDHVSGIIYMMKQAKRRGSSSMYSHLFRHIYIPNIWDNPFSIVALCIEEAILNKQLKDTSLPYNTASSLFDLIRFLGLNAKKVTLLNRGVEFEGKFVALWPPVGDLRDDFLDALLRDTGLQLNLINGLIPVAEEICEYMRGAFSIEGENAKVEFELNVIDQYETRVNSIISQYGDNIGNEANSLIQLNKLNHKYNVVFQDITQHGENVLFTGDAEKEDMNSIASKVSDCRLQLKERYKYIKIPHHGTPAHYFDFTSNNPQYLLIPNGKIKKHEKDEAYMIDRQYCHLCVEHLCSNSNNCSCGCCRCGKGQTIYPYIFREIK